MFTNLSDDNMTLLIAAGVFVFSLFGLMIVMIIKGRSSNSETPMSRPTTPPPNPFANNAPQPITNTTSTSYLDQMKPEEIANTINDDQINGGFNTMGTMAAPPASNPYEALASTTEINAQNDAPVHQNTISAVENMSNIAPQPIIPTQLDQPVQLPNPIIDTVQATPIQMNTVPTPVAAIPAASIVPSPVAVNTVEQISAVPAAVQSQTPVFDINEPIKQTQEFESVISPVPTPSVVPTPVAEPIMSAPTVFEPVVVGNTPQPMIEPPVQSQPPIQMSAPAMDIPTIPASTNIAPIQPTVFDPIIHTEPVTSNPAPQPMPQVEQQIMPAPAPTPQSDPMNIIPTAQTQTPQDNFGLPPL